MWIQRSEPFHSQLQPACGNKPRSMAKTRSGLESPPVALDIQRVTPFVRQQLRPPGGLARLNGAPPSSRDTDPSAFFRHRKPHIDGCSAAWLALNREVTTRLLDDRPHDGQAETGSAPGHLRRKEWFDGSPQSRVVHTDARIANRNPQHAGGLVRRDIGRNEHLRGRRDSNLASIGHRIASVDDEVEKRHFELVAVRLDRWQSWADVELNNDSGGQGGRKDLAHADDEF